MGKITVALDVECYKNYFLVVVKAIDGGKTLYVSMYNDKPRHDNRLILETVFKKHTIVTFNGAKYDLPMVSAFLAGKSNIELKRLSDSLIEDSWGALKNIVVRQCDHIDLMGVTPLQASLKTYGCRIHAPKLQDLPIHPAATIKGDQLELLEHYCLNDVDVTIQIFKTLLPQIKLRHTIGNEYCQDMRSLSDAQIAEACIRGKLSDAGMAITKRGGDIKPFKYKTPGFIRFETDVFKRVLASVNDVEFNVKDTGHVRLPDELNKAIEFKGAKYKLGIGGLHSQEKKQAIKRVTQLGEYDVASMYPTIILNQGLYPEHLGDGFISVYKDIYKTRLAAKARGDSVVSDTLKIVLNSSYGKFGSKYSFLYSPELLVQTTITGQLALLMLIEKLPKTVSANTDGVVSVHDSEPECVSWWQEQTGMALEWTPYEAIYSRDVNNYIAIGEKGVKSKGIYEYGSIRKGYSNEICIDAIINHLTGVKSIADTVNECKDVRRFLTMRGVRGGATWRGSMLGKVVRWYRSTSGQPIKYLSNGNKVAGSDNAHPMMDLCGLPDDVDLNWYIERSEKLLNDLGVYK